MKEHVHRWKIEYSMNEGKVYALCECGLRLLEKDIVRALNTYSLLERVLDILEERLGKD